MKALKVCLIIQDIHEISSYRRKIWLKKCLNPIRESSWDYSKIHLELYQVNAISLRQNLFNDYDEDFPFFDDYDWKKRLVSNQSSPNFQNESDFLDKHQVFQDASQNSVFLIFGTMEFLQRMLDNENIRVVKNRSVFSLVRTQQNY